MFAGKRTLLETWNVWEMDVDGRNKRQLTRDLGNCREPEYLATSSISPAGFCHWVRWITFVSDAAGTIEGSTEPATSPYVTNTEPIKGCGTNWRTTSTSSDFSPAVLRDGEDLVTRCSLRVALPARGTLSSAGRKLGDGSGLNIFAGDAQGCAFKTMAIETPDRHLAFVESASPSALGGQLARLSGVRFIATRVTLQRREVTT